MLPFLKNRDGAAASPVETKEREHDETYDIVDAIAEDFKAGRFKEAIQSLIDHIQALDVEQDQEMGA